MQAGRDMGTEISVCSSRPDAIRSTVMSSDPWLAITIYSPMMAKSLGILPPVGMIWRRASPPASRMAKTAMLSWPRLLT